MISDPKDEELYHLNVDLESGKSKNHDLLTTKEGEKHVDAMIPPDTPNFDNTTEVDMRQLPTQAMK